MSAKKPTVSVLIPAYNAEPYLKEAIDSILSQTLQDFELVVIDDCSTDGTAKIVREYVKKDSRVRGYFHKKNLNITKTRNELIGYAAGEYVAWQDADDISMPKRLEKQLAYMKKHPKVGICGGYIELFSEAGPLGVRRYPKDDRELRRVIFRHAAVAQPAAMIRKGCFDEVGLFDETIPQSQAEDLDMCFRIGERYQMANIPETVIRYRVHQASATSRKLRQMELNTVNLRSKYGRSLSYNMTTMDRVYNLAQFVSIFIIPAKTKIWLFNKIRDSKEKNV